MKCNRQYFLASA